MRHETFFVRLKKLHSDQPINYHLLASTSPQYEPKKQNVCRQQQQLHHTPTKHIKSEPTTIKGKTPFQPKQNEQKEKKTTTDSVS